MPTVVNNPAIIKKLSKIEQKINQESLSEILGVSTRYIRYIKENKRSVKNQEQTILEIYNKLFTQKTYKKITKFTKVETQSFIIKNQKLKYKTKTKDVNANTAGKQYIYNYKNTWSKINKNFKFNVNFQYKKIIETLKNILSKNIKFPVKIFVSPIYDVKENTGINKLASSQHTFLISSKKDIKKYLKNIYNTFLEYEFYVQGIINSLYSDAISIKISGARITLLSDKK